MSRCRWNWPAMPRLRSAPRANWRPSGSATVCTITRHSSRAASSSVSRWRACARPRHPGRRRAHRESRRGDRKADRRSPVHQACRARHDAGAGDPRRLARTALRPRGAPALGPHRRRQGGPQSSVMSIASEPISASLASEPARGGRPASLSLRYALRELRGGLRGFYVFIACIALGVMAIAGVGSVAASLRDGLAREGRNLLGGDVAFALFQREAKPAEVEFLRSRGQVSVAATARAMARAADGRLALVELKAVDGAYPMLGELALNPKVPLGELFAARDGKFGAAVDPTLLARLDLKIGDVVSVGEASFQIRSVVDAEPDKLAGGIGLGPRFLVDEAGLRATGLIQPGSLVRWVYRVRLPDGTDDDRATATLIDDARQAAPEAGWEIRSRANASPQLERTIDRFTQFLTLVGLAALLVGGVGVANAVKSHIDRRLDVIAAFKALRATGRDVFARYLTQVIVLAGLGSMICLVACAVLPF